jgi:predicted TIM-barrel fold metal-dependent hydrolase
MKKADIRRRLAREADLIDVHTHVGIDPVNFARGDYPYGISGQDMLLRMESQGIDAAVCFPMLYTTYFRFHAFREGRFTRDPAGPSEFPYRAENENLCREIYEAFPPFAGRLLPFAFFDPARKPGEQAAFLKDLAEEFPLFGLKTATSYLQSHIASLLGRGRPLLDLAAERNLPLTIHSSVLPGDPWANVFEILKVARARPDIRFNLAHTCRFDRRALDEAAAIPNAFVDISAFYIHCTLAQRNHPAVARKAQRFPADYRRRADALKAIANAYPDTILWGTDTPFNLFKSRFFDERGTMVKIDLDCPPDGEIKIVRALPPALRRRIGRTNTLRFLFGSAGETKR